VLPLVALQGGLAVAAVGVEAQTLRVAPSPLAAGGRGVEGLRDLSSLSARAEREVERLIAEASARVAAAVPMEDESAKRAMLVAAEVVADSALAM
jgi:hypothetical protein